MSLEQNLIKPFEKEIYNFLMIEKVKLEGNAVSLEKADIFIENNKEEINRMIKEMCEMGFDTSGINFIANLGNNLSDTIYSHIINDEEFYTKMVNLRKGK
jgi:hypothetical protein